MEPLVIYIIGDNRSGSTLLDYLLSCHPDAISVGELHHLHDYYCKIGIGKRRNWKCSCGVPIQKCKFWSGILKEVSFSEGIETRLNYNESKWSFLNHGIHKKAIKKLIKNETYSKNARFIVENRWEIYRSITRQTGKSIIIDSSKDGFDAFFLDKYSNGNIRFLLLERDIRGVAYSKRERVQELYKGKIISNSKVESIYKYLLYSYKILWRNRFLMDLIRKHSGNKSVYKVNYSRLSQNHEEVMQDICSFLNIKYFEPPKKTGQNKESLHILHGSPSRYEIKVIQQDVRWKSYFKDRPLALFLSKVLQQL